MDTDDAWNSFRKTSVLGKLDTIASQLNDIKTDTERTAKLVPKILGDENAVDVANASPAGGDPLAGVTNTLSEAESAGLPGGDMPPEGATPEAEEGGGMEGEEMPKKKEIEKADDSEEEMDDAPMGDEADTGADDTAVASEDDVTVDDDLDDEEKDDEEDDGASDRLAGLAGGGEDLDDEGEDEDDDDLYFDLDDEDEDVDDLDDEDMDELGDEDTGGSDLGEESESRLARIMRLQADLNAAISELITDRITKGDASGGARIANAFASFEKSWRTDLNKSIDEVYGSDYLSKSDDIGAPEEPVEAGADAIAESDCDCDKEDKNKDLVKHPVEECNDSGKGDIAKSATPNVMSFKDMVGMFKTNARPPQESWANRDPMPPDLSEIRKSMGITGEGDSTLKERSIKGLMDSAHADREAYKLFMAQQKL